MNFSNLINLDAVDEFENDLKIETETVSEHGIAIIGISSKFGESKNAQEFWNNIVTEKDSIRILPKNRQKDYDDYQNALLHSGILKEKKKYGEYSYLDEIDTFDPEFFNISPIEARVMDPNQRMLLESMWEAIENAGYGGKKLVHSKTGVFVGFSSDFARSYKELIMLLEPSMAPLSVPGNIRSIIASRISYLLDLHGPSMMIDTACSSSLVAVHTACNSIRRGECDLAIAGGVKLALLALQNESTGVGVEIESQTGRTRTFDDDSDGTGSGEGVASILLKPLDQAIKDKDHIYAVIKGSAINQDGTTVGITAPSADAQADVIKKAWEDAGIHPESISYIEAHGTGTKLGDPIEITGIDRAYRSYTNKKQFCGIGSVKTNIGHLDNVSGMAGLIKVILMLNHRQIPASIHFQKPNRKIDFLNSPVYVNDTIQDLIQTEYPIRCGINSFGLSGTNCHMVIEGAPIIHEENITEEEKVHVFTLSAKTPEALKRMILDYAQFNRIHGEANMTDICYTANTGRGHYGVRLAVVLTDKQNFVSRIEELSKQDQINSDPARGIYYEDLSKARKAQAVSVNVTFSQDQISLLQQKIINETVTIEEYHQLSKMYCQGADIAWEDLYASQEPKKRISLPTYSFDQKRYWVNKEIKGQEDKFIDLRKKEIDHPLIDQCIVHSMEEDIYGTNFTVAKHWVLNEHKVNNNYVIPGTTYIEMLRMLCQEELGYSDFELKNLTFISPLMVETDEIREVQTILKHCNGYLEASIVSKPKGEKKFIKHAEARVYEQKEHNSQKFEIDEIKARMNKGIVRNSVGAKGLVDTGHRWDNCEAIYLGDNELLALLSLPEEYATDCENYKIHPALMDNAMNIAINSIGDGLYLPLSYQSLIVYDDMPSKFYSFVEMNQEQVQVNETFRFHVLLMDLEGRVFAEATNYSIKKVHNKELNPEVSYEGFYHHMVWKVKPLELQAKNEMQEKVVVFWNDENRIQPLLGELKDRGCEVIEVCYGVSQNPHIKTLGTEEENQELLSKIFSKKVDRVIFSSMENTSVAVLREKQMDKITALFYLLKAMAIYPLDSSVELDVLLNCTNEVTGKGAEIKPDHAAMVGMCRVVAQETNHIRCHVIDTDDSTDIATIIDEMTVDSQSDQVAYRENERYVEVLEEMHPKRIERTKVSIKEGGTYLITGGFGGLGIEIACWIAKNQPSHIVLLNRSKVPEHHLWKQIIEDNENEKVCEKLKRLLKIEEEGSDVSCYCADVTEYDSLHMAIEKVRAQFGKIDGIFHCAGVTGNGLLATKDVSTLKSVILPKVNGTLNLDLCTQTEDLDFFVMYSSVSSFIGYMGQGDYSAANAYMDAYAAYRVRQGKPALAINWPIWKETGMAHEFGLGDGETILQPILTEQGMHILGDVISLPASRVIVGKLNYEVLRQYQSEISIELSDEIKKRLTENETQEMSAKKQTTMNFVGGDALEIEQKVAQIYASTLEIESISLDQSFYDMGGDSILATYLFKELDREFPGIVDVSDIFRYETVGSMAEYIANSLGITEEKTQSSETTEGKKADEDDLERLLNQLADGEIDVDQADLFLK